MAETGAVAAEQKSLSNFRMASYGAPALPLSMAMLPLAVYLTAYGPGSFMLIHPGAPSASELEAWNARAAEAVELAAINHGNSIQAEHVTLWTRTVWAEPSGLAAAADTIIDRTKQELLERQ